MDLALRRNHARQGLEGGSLARAVGSDQADEFAFLDGKDMPFTAAMPP
jgi:hypothetical protein